MGKRQLKNEEVLQKVIARIKQLRKQKGITQEDFYYDININLARIESGKNNITISTLHAICDYMGISFEEFFKGL